VESPAILGRDETADQESEELDCTAGDLEILCSECIEAEGLDDDGCELLLLLVSFTLR
jgi:hypothetical protein